MSGLSMGEHIKNICRSCNISLRSLSKIRFCLTEDSATNTYPCLHNLQSWQLEQLTDRTKYGYHINHISGVLKKLHWLPIKARIDNKVLLLVFKWLMGIGPSYLKELLSIKTYSRYNTRYSKDTLRLSGPEMNLKTMGDRAFKAYVEICLSNIVM